MNRVVFCASFAAAALTLGGCAAEREARRPPVQTGMVAFTSEAGGEARPSVVYVPENYTHRKEWPLIVFLHGMGERGDDGWKQTTVGIGPAIQANPERFPCLVVMPQCSTSYVWRAGAGHEHITSAIQHVLDTYNIDPARISLTGLSMGGYGTFSYGAEHIDLFSATMPVCGGGDPGDAATLARVPMRVFHGAEDSVVPPERSRQMVEAIKAAGGDVAYTEYPNTNHNSWDQAYGDADNIAWLLSQRRPE